MLNLLRFILLYLASIFLLFSCNKKPEKSWEHAIPQHAAAVIIPEQRTSLNTVFSADFIPFIQQISSTPPEVITSIENASGSRLLLKAIAIYPVGSLEWVPLWVTQTGPKDIPSLNQYFSRAFTEQSYLFEGVRIFRFFLPNSDIILFGAQLHGHAVISSNSLAVEASIRSYLRIDEPMKTSFSVSEQSYFINFASFDMFARLFANVRFRPAIEGAFEGLGATQFNVEKTQGRDNQFNFTYSGSVPLGTQKSTLVNSLTRESGTFQSENIIPTDAAFFAQFRSFDTFALSDIPALGALDSSIVGQPGLVTAIQTLMQRETAFIGFNTIGFSPLEETVFIRRTSNSSALRAELERLFQRGQIQKVQDFYSIRSRYLAKILGGELCYYQDFYAGFTDQYIILAPRTGLIQRVINDQQRRRVMAFDDEFMRIRRQQPSTTGAFVYARNPDFRNFLIPFTDAALSSEPFVDFYDVVTLSITPNTTNNNADLVVQTHALRTADRAFRERWFYPLDGSKLTGAVVMGNLSNASRNEILFGTTGNRVIALASDGTEIFRAATGEDTPIGSPVLFDWYANNQTAILIGAGNKIYAWNNRGQLLPGFPFTLAEDITSPIVVADVTRSGLPEIIVTTADRQVHVLNNRGVNVQGWPQRVNSVVRTSPVFESFNGQRAVISYSENGVFAWNSSGTLMDGFPIFLETGLNGSPVVSNNRILAGGLDGRLYSISSNYHFDTAVSRRITEERSSAVHKVESIQVSESSLTVAASRELTIRDETGVESNQRAILMNSKNGAVFLYSMNGRLLFSQNMGQPSDDLFIPFFSDIRTDNHPEIVALGVFGRTFAWSPRRNIQVDGLPTTAVQHPNVIRMVGENSPNLIAGTTDGVRAWVLLRP
mgnify:CR=1 FL=1